MARPLKDLTGQTFGEWTVLGRAYTTIAAINGVVHWNCRCSCGATQKVRSFSLRTGRSTRCRSCVNELRSEDLTDRRFGRWLVLGPGGRDNQFKLLWDCQCDCGTVRQIRTGNLVSGYSTQCKSCAVRNRANRPR